MLKLLNTMLQGTWISLELFFLTLIFSLPLGMLVAMAKKSRFFVVRKIINIYIMIMRGTPLILQLIFVYFTPYYLFNASFSSRMAAAIFAYVINYAAYFSEIYRGGIQSIDKGQYEAGKVLGFTKSYTFFHVILPQVVKEIMPAMGNEVITLVKDTALAQTIGVAELFRVAQTASSREFSTVPLFVAGVFYFVMNAVVSKMFEKVETKLNYY